MGQQRKGLPCLCYKKLDIFLIPIQIIRKVLQILELDCIQKVKVNSSWKQRFAPYLSQRSDIHKLLLLHICVSTHISPKKNVVCYQILLSVPQVGLYMDSVSVLEFCLKQVLRCLKALSQILSITDCFQNQT